MKRAAILTSKVFVYTLIIVSILWFALLLATYAGIVVGLGVGTALGH